MTSILDLRYDAMKINKMCGMNSQQHTTVDADNSIKMPNLYFGYFKIHSFFGNSCISC